MPLSKGSSPSESGSDGDGGAGAVDSGDGSRLDSDSGKLSRDLSSSPDVSMLATSYWSWPSASTDWKSKVFSRFLQQCGAESRGQGNVCIGVFIIDIANLKIYLWGQKMFCNYYT